MNVILEVKRSIQYNVIIGLCILIAGVVGCSPKKYRESADSEVEQIIRQKQIETKGHTEPFTIETPADTLRRRLLIDQKLPYAGPSSLGSDVIQPVEDWPEEDQPTRAKAAEPSFPWDSSQTLKLSLMDALMVAAANNRDYQSQKEDIFRVALGMNLERDAFRNTYYGALGSDFVSDHSGDDTITGIANSGSFEWSRLFKYGAALSSRILIDLVSLLTPGSSSSLGIYADATISIPLMAGSGKNIVTEPLKQAERDVIYSMYTFERFKRSLAVQIAGEYLSVLRQLDVLKNAEENFKRLKLGAKRTERMTDAGRLPRIQLDQARQDVLRAGNSWVTSKENYASRLDSFKVSMGLPPDARVELDRSELEKLEIAAQKNMDESASVGEMVRDDTLLPAQSEADTVAWTDNGLYTLNQLQVVSLALSNRLDLRVSKDRVNDAQRKVVVAADALRAGLTLTGSGAWGERRDVGSADLDNAKVKPSSGIYNLGLLVDLPWERTQEGNIYRESYILLEQRVRDVQGLEDQIKLQVRSALRTLRKNRESYQIQTLAVKLASQRVKSAALFLEAGRAQVRDVLEAQDDLVSAKNDRMAALVDYRVTELELQRDMGLIEVDHRGIWNEYRPE